jgi:hypothetical protein
MGEACSSRDLGPHRKGWNAHRYRALGGLAEYNSRDSSNSSSNDVLVTCT